ncbi:MAG: hypothetical protein M1832_000835 [Thelocarpon impressellum]|nr:MAG: hypothetical protein M1832_000835 [Thelocarpon impressellum]
MDESLANHQKANVLTSTPPELLVQICSLLEAEDLSALSRTCRLLRSHAEDDSHWQPLVQRNLPGCTLKGPSFAKSFRQLFVAHHPHWFLPRYKIWFGDEAHTGKLLVARYDPRRAVIEAHRLVAERLDSGFEPWEHDPAVRVHNFRPRVRTHLDYPVLRLEPKLDTPTRAFQAEVAMTTPGSADGVFHNLILTRRLPPELAENPDMAVWPPPTVPATQRVSATPREKEAAHQPPETLRQLSDMAFRLRKWMEFVHAGRPVGMRMGEDIFTYSTLSPELYLPTETMPWRGIWVGDYAGHGCEFLLVIQEQDKDDADAAIPGCPGNVAGARPVPSGMLQAVKLTGDPNVPRGQITFVADDLSDGGLVRIANEEMFKGARIVRSRGHVASAGFADDHYMESQLFLISHDRLAQYWLDLGLISFYERVDVDSFLQAQ